MRLITSNTLNMARLNLFVAISAQLYLVTLSRGDNAIQSISDLPSPFPFFGKLHRRIYITNDGLLTLTKPPRVIRQWPQLIANEDDIIAPFWADVDTTLRGQVWFRITTNEDVLQLIKAQLFKADKNICNPLYSLIVTWNNASYFRYHYDKINTFQCVLTTDGSSSFAIFIYKKNGIQWTTGDASGGTLGILTETNGVAAIVGVSHNGTQIVTPASGTQDIIDISSTSNVNISGVWIFQLNGETSRGCNIRPNSNIFFMDTLISVIAIGVVMLLLLLGAIYGYSRVGKYIIITQNSHNSMRSSEKSTHEKLLRKN